MNIERLLWTAVEFSSLLNDSQLEFAGLVLTEVGPDNFEARSPDELSLSKGDRIELIERDDDFGDGWYLGKHVQNGKTGLFPEGEISVFVRVGRRLTLPFGSLHHNYTKDHSSCSNHHGNRCEDCG